MKYFPILIFLMTLSISSCRKNPTTWDSDWIAPILKDSLLISNFVNDSTLAVNADNSIQVVLDRNLIDLDLSELVEIPDTTVVQDFSLSVSSLTLPPGSNFIDEIQEHDFDMGEVVLLDVRVKTGKAKITIENPMNTKGIFEVELPGVSKDGVEFSQTEEIEANSVKSFDLNLRGYSIDMRGEQGDSYNKLQSKMSVTTDPNGGSVTLTDQDVVKFTVDFENLKMDYAKGYFGKSTFSDTTDLKLDALANLIGGSINLDDINFDLSILNGIKAVAQAEISLFESTNFNNSVISLSHPDFGNALNLDPAQGYWANHSPSERTLNFEPNTSNIIPFLENLGYNYRVGYNIKINPWGNVSNSNDEIFPGSRLRVNLKSDFLLDLAADDLTLKDTFEVDFSGEERFLRVKSGYFIVKSVNTFPYGGGMELFLLDENQELLGTLSSDKSLTAALLNSANSGHQMVKGELTFQIPENVINNLSRVTNIIVQVKMNSAYSSNNVVYADDQLKFLLQSKLKLKSEL